MLREAHSLRVFENRELKRIAGPKSDQVTGCWRKLHSEELHNMCSSPNFVGIVRSRRKRWVRNVSHMREITNAYRISKKSEVKRPLQRPTLVRCEDIIKMNLK